MRVSNERVSIKEIDEEITDDELDEAITDVSFKIDMFFLLSDLHIKMDIDNQLLTFKSL